MGAVFFFGGGGDIRNEVLLVYQVILNWWVGLVVWGFL